MKSPPTPKLTISTPPTSDATGQSSQFLGVLYLALTKLIDSALPAVRPWAVAGKALYYLVKLGPIIWWAMLVPTLTPPSPAEALRYSWYPDISLKTSQKHHYKLNMSCLNVWSSILALQIPAKPLNSLKDLAHTVDERFVLVNIPDNTLGQDNLLSAIELEDQNEKLQQFPLIGETAAKRQTKDSKIKKCVFEKDGFYTPAARRAWGLARTRPPPASRGQCIPTARVGGPAGWGNCSMGKPKKAISLTPKGGGTSAQIWNLPNLGGADKLPNPTILALTAEVKFGYMKASNDTPNQCKPRSNNSFPAHHFQFPSQKGIPDNTKCLGFPVQCFTLFMPHKDDSI
ncbi:hypothetical protein DSO57_1015261 [Entomophthora muscae]|uniref:Uncharacterized protein n=1 Tax=Entomophthora muscae TaxID=34485 RepID=A0ACC2T5A9_9FUNG|nr:hypothetical protein DSO57_1015261 [Entomophthora muscae]